LGSQLESSPEDDEKTEEEDEDHLLSPIPVVSAGSSSLPDLPKRNEDSPRQLGKKRKRREAAEAGEGEGGLREELRTLRGEVAQLRALLRNCRCPQQ
jgi:hypothetical protein